ncbi:DUF5798 family protein [Halosimplex aquaticum]
MPFGDTAKKISRVADIAEKLYERLNQVIEQVQEVRERVERTSDQIESIDRELAEQRVIVEALAEQQDIDVDSLIDEQLPDPEADATDEGEGDGDGEEAGRRCQRGCRRRR